LPIGKYKDLAECVVDQKNKGKSDEAAKKICGALEESAKEKDKPKKELIRFFTKSVQDSEKDGNKYLEGILSTSVLDRGNDRISKALITKWASDTTPIPLLSVHQNHWQEQVGIIKERRSLANGDALYIKAVLLKSTTVAKEFTDYLEELKSHGMGVGLSIGAANPIREEIIDSEKGSMFSLIKDAELVEGSVVPIGMNQEAFGHLAKKYDLEIGGVTKMTDEVVEDPKEEVTKEVPAEEPKVEEKPTEEKPVKEEAPVEGKVKEASQDVELKKVLLRMDSLEKKTEESLTKALEKAIGELKADKKSVVEKTDKEKISILDKKLWKEEE